MPEPSADIAQVTIIDKPKVSTSLSRETQPRLDLQQKQAAWNSKRQEIDHLMDYRGQGLDEGIKESVLAFNMNGLYTVASHERPENGIATPWIDIAAPNKPSTRFNDEAAILQRAAEAYGVSVEDMKTSHTKNASAARGQAEREFKRLGETPEYTAWRGETKQQGQKARTLLDEFYSDKDTPSETRLSAREFIDGERWRVGAGIEGEQFLTESTRSPEEEEKLLLARQAEMLAFTEFLRLRYFTE